MKAAGTRGAHLIGPPLYLFYRPKIHSHLTNSGEVFLMLVRPSKILWGFAALSSYVPLVLTPTKPGFDSKLAQSRKNTSFAVLLHNTQESREDHNYWVCKVAVDTSKMFSMQLPKLSGALEQTHQTSSFSPGCTFWQQKASSHQAQP